MIWDRGIAYWMLDLWPVNHTRSTLDPKHQFMRHKIQLLADLFDLCYGLCYASYRIFAFVIAEYAHMCPQFGNFARETTSLVAEGTMQRLFYELVVKKLEGCLEGFGTLPQIEGC